MLIDLTLTSLNSIFSVFDNKNLKAILTLTISSIYLRVLLQLFGQSWVRTKAHTGTLMLLPLIVYVITSVISGNIALSLGMVGALSIVRFRNPVRSPIELSAYFCAITLGIAASVALNWVVFLVFSITFGTVVLSILNFIYPKVLNHPYFITSFSEGNSLSTLSVTTSKELEILENNRYLISKKVSNDVISYILASNDFIKLKELQANTNVKKNTLTLELRK